MPRNKGQSFLQKFDFEFYGVFLSLNFPILFIQIMSAGYDCESSQIRISKPSGNPERHTFGSLGLWAIGQCLPSHLH